jgi:hypothetical protein
LAVAPDAVSSAAVLVIPWTDVVAALCAEIAADAAARSPCGSLAPECVTIAAAA